MRAHLLAFGPTQASGVANATADRRPRPGARRRPEGIAPYRNARAGGGIPLPSAGTTLRRASTGGHPRCPSGARQVRSRGWACRKDRPSFEGVATLRGDRKSSAWRPGRLASRLRTDGSDLPAKPSPSPAKTVAANYEAGHRDQPIGETDARRILIDATSLRRSVIKNVLGLIGCGAFVIVCAVITS